MTAQVTSARLSTSFVARERELEQLQAFLDRALAGQGQVCFVTGEAGSGKTALVNEFARRAQAQHEDLLVAIGSCNAQTGSGDPYLPFRDVLRLLTGDVDTDAISDENASRLSSFLRVSGRALAELGPDLIDIFVPGAGLVTRAAGMVASKTGWLDRLEQLSGQQARRQALAGTPGADDTGLEQSHIFEQYTNVLHAMAAQQPLVLVLDDLQWADADSINLLFHLCRRNHESRILMIGTYRPNDLVLGRPSTTGQAERHPLEPVVNELRRYHGDIEIALGHEEAAEGRRFVDALVDTEPNRLGEAFRQALFRHTNGHPLFTVELLRDMQERGDVMRDDAGRWIEGEMLDWSTLPARVEGVIGERIDRLEVELRETLAVASVEGEDFTAEVIARVQAMEERGLVRRLSRELDKRHRLVGAVGAQRLGRQRLSLYRFQHNLFQKYLYNGLDEVERSFLHEDVGLVLEELYGHQADELAAIAPQLARHFEQAGLEEKAQHYVFEAGARARRQYANEDALVYLDRALALTPESDAAARYGVLLEREKVYGVLGKREAQHRDLAALERLAEALDDRDRAQVALRRAHYAEVTGDFQAALAAARQAVTWAEQAGALEIQAAGYLQWGRALWRQADYPAATTQLEKALRAFRQSGVQRGEGRTLSALGNVAAERGDYAAARTYYEQAEHVCEEIGDRQGEAIVVSNIATILWEQGDCSGAKTHHEEALHICRQIGDREGEGYTLSNLGRLADDLGDYAEAAAYCEQALRIRREVDDRLGEGLTLTNMGLLFHRRGDDGAARDYGQQALLIAQEVGDRRLQGYALTNLGHALAGLDLLEEASDAYQQALDLRQGLDQQAAAMESLAGLARVALAQGDLPQAQNRVEEILNYLTESVPSSRSGHGLDGAEEPLRVHLTCYRVLRAMEDPRAPEVLARAYELLQEQAGRIRDEDMRRSFLENVPAHREIVERNDAAERRGLQPSYADPVIS